MASDRETGVKRKGGQRTASLSLGKKDCKVAGEGKAEVEKGRKMSKRWGEIIRSKRDF